MLNKALIVTYHGTLNYGAELQAMAMQKVFSGYFLEVQLLNYKPKYLVAPYKLLDFTRFRGFIATVLNFPTALIKKWRFHLNEKKYVNATKTMYSCCQDEIVCDADWIILGSDQIWNLQINGNGDPVFFGAFRKSSSKVMSFSASIGNDHITDDEKIRYRELIKTVDRIAVREQTAKQMLLCSGVNKPIHVTIDPTFLVSVKEWRNIQKKVNVPKRYILVYSLNKYNRTYQTAYEISKSENIPIVEVLGSNIDFLNLPKHQIIATAGPREFLYLIDHASFVVTDSFHGTAFSIIYQKDFYVIPHITRGARMIELMQNLGLSDRMLGKDKKADFDNVIDWDCVYKKLNEEIKHSREYIEKCICNEEI